MHVHILWLVAIHVYIPCFIAIYIPCLYICTVHRVTLCTVHTNKEYPVQYFMKKPFKCDSDMYTSCSTLHEIITLYYLHSLSFLHDLPPTNHSFTISSFFLPACLSVHWPGCFCLHPPTPGQPVCLPACLPAGLPPFLLQLYCESAYGKAIYIHNLYTHGQC